MTTTLKTFGAGLALGLSALASGAAAQSCEVKIGGIFPTSVDWGRPIAETAKFAVDQVNAGGGINGCTVDLLLRDSQSDPKGPNPLALLSFSSFFLDVLPWSTSPKLDPGLVNPDLARNGFTTPF